MNNGDVRVNPETTDTQADDQGSGNRLEWQEPKLTFIEPALTPHGPLTAVTGQFFGPFSPPPAD
jgi:hypothetical protein